MNRNKKYNDRINRKCKDYPCAYLLNSALRFLLTDQERNLNAISEICWCIKKAEGEFAEDVAKELINLGYDPKFVGR